MQDQFERQEWDLIIADSKNEWNRSAEIREKFQDQIKKSFELIDNRINNSIFDAEKKKQAIQNTEDFKQPIMQVQKDYNQYNIVDNTTLQDFEASESALQLVFDQKNALRKQLCNGYIKLILNYLN